jgi:hypothetical protein
MGSVIVYRSEGIVANDGKDESPRSCSRVKKLLPWWVEPRSKFSGGSIFHALDRAANDEDLSPSFHSVSSVELDTRDIMDERTATCILFTAIVVISSASALNTHIHVSLALYPSIYKYLAIPQTVRLTY